MSQEMKYPDMTQEDLSCFVRLGVKIEKIRLSTEKTLKMPKKYK